MPVISPTQTPEDEKMPKYRAPTELQEQRELATWLRAVGLLWLHVPNEGRRSRRQGALLRSAGMSAGAPDVLIFDAPPAMPSARGVAIELKRARPAGKPSQVSAKQRQWLADLAEQGWQTSVAFGAADAIAQLEKLGWSRPQG